MLGAVQPADAADSDLVCSRAFDIGAHLVEQIREVLHFRFARSIFENRNPLGEGSRHHQILGAGHGNRVEVEVRPAQAVGPGIHVAVVETDGSAQVFRAP